MTPDVAVIYNNKISQATSKKEISQALEKILNCKFLLSSESENNLQAQFYEFKLKKINCSIVHTAHDFYAIATDIRHTYHFIVFVIPLGECTGLIKNGKKIRQKCYPIVCTDINEINKNWRYSPQTLIVTVPVYLAYQLAIENALFFPGTDLNLLSVMHLSDDDQIQFYHLLKLLLNFNLYTESLAFNRQWIDQIEKSIALFSLQLLMSEGNRKQDQVTKTAPIHNKQTLEWLENAAAFVKPRLAYPLTINDLLAATGYNRPQLYAAFKNCIGVPPAEWIRNLRLDASLHHLVLHPDEPVSQLAVRFGFGNPGRFVGYFRQRFAITPGELARTLD